MSSNTIRLFLFLCFGFSTSLKAQTRIVFTKIDSICVVKAKQQLSIFYQKKFLEVYRASRFGYRPLISND